MRPERRPFPEGTPPRWPSQRPACHSHSPLSQPAGFPPQHTQSLLTHCSSLRGSYGSFQATYVSTPTPAAHRPCSSQGGLPQTKLTLGLASAENLPLAPCSPQGSLGSSTGHTGPLSVGLAQPPSFLPLPLHLAFSHTPPPAALGFLRFFTFLPLSLSHAVPSPGMLIPIPFSWLSPPLQVSAEAPPPPGNLPDSPRLR